MLQWKLSGEIFGPKDWTPNGDAEHKAERMSAIAEHPNANEQAGRSFAQAAGSEVPTWRSLINDRPARKGKILYAYRGCTRRPGDWQLGVSAYDPEIHRIFVYWGGVVAPWMGDMIKRKDVHWMCLPLPPDVEEPPPNNKLRRGEENH